MVERIDGQGKGPEQILGRLGRYDFYDFRFVYFLRGTLEERAQAEYLALGCLANYPEFDRRSILFTNVADRNLLPGSLLAVPRSTPYLETYQSGDAMPKEGETYVALWKSLDNPDANGEFLLICDSISRAWEVANDLSQRLLDFDQDEIELLVDHVTPEEFVDIARRRIVKFKSVPPFVLGYAGLGKLKEEVERQSSSQDI